MGEKCSRKGFVIFVHILHALFVLTYLVVSIVFFALMAADTRTTVLTGYNAAVKTWTEGGRDAFAAPPKAFSVSVTSVSPALAPASGSFPLSLSTAPSPPIASNVDGDVSTYSLYAAYTGTRPSPAAYTLPNDLSTTVRITVSLGGVSTSLTVSDWWVATYDTTCTQTSKSGRTCKCADGGVDTSGSGQCKLAFHLDSVCLVWNGTGFADYGCALLSPMQAQYPSYTLPVNGVGMAGYVGVGGDAPTGTATSFNPTITVRSSQDPYVVLLQLNGGSLDLPISQAVKAIVGGAFMAFFLLAAALQTWVALTRPGWAVCRANLGKQSLLKETQVAHEGGRPMALGTGTRV